MKIEINNLSKLYHKNVALEIEHLSLDAGCVLGLVGNNGAGKTTLLRLILDLIKANSGRVLLNGLDVHRNEGWKQHTGSYMDEGFLIPFLTPEEYFLFIARNYNLSFDIMEQRLNLFHSFFAGEILNNNKYIRDFSLGNKRKIGIAGALAVNPKLLILDEPFANLDPRSQNELVDLINTAKKALNLTALISSHDLEHVANVSDRIAILEKGDIVKDIYQDKSTVDSLKKYFVV